MFGKKKYQLKKIKELNFENLEDYLNETEISTLRMPTEALLAARNEYNTVLRAKVVHENFESLLLALYEIIKQCPDDAELSPLNEIYIAAKEAYESFACRTENLEDLDYQLIQYGQRYMDYWSNFVRKQSADEMLSNLRTFGEHLQRNFKAMFKPNYITTACGLLLAITYLKSSSTDPAQLSEIDNINGFCEAYSVNTLAEETLRQSNALQFQGNEIQEQGDNLSGYLLYAGRSLFAGLGGFSFFKTFKQAYLVDHDKNLESIADDIEYLKKIRDGETYGLSEQFDSFSEAWTLQ